MITDVPTATDFSEQGLNHLHLAWEIGVVLLRELRNAQDNGEVDEESSADFWRLSQPSLANAFTLIQQAQEFLLKSRIAAVNANLLLTRDPRDWPRRCEQEDTPFSAFRMADAADLLKIHNTVANKRLPKEFAEFYEQTRRQRNVIMHVGLKLKTIDVSSILVSVLQTYTFLVGGKSWPLRRAEYSDSDAIAVLYSNDHVGDAILMEFDAIVDLLKPAELLKFFGFDKKARRYICPECMNRTEHLDERPALAQLEPNTPASKSVYCFVCETTTEVLRQACSSAGCKSNVLSADDDTCLVCWK